MYGCKISKLIAVKQKLLTAINLRNPHLIAIKSGKMGKNSRKVSCKSVKLVNMAAQLKVSKTPQFFPLYSILWFLSFFH
jgi:hypothetical protein